METKPPGDDMGGSHRKGIDDTKTGDPLKAPFFPYMGTGERQHMTARIIAISNQKGGTGKTALTYEIGRILSRRYKVLYIDLDGQRDLTRLLTDTQHDRGALEGMTEPEGIEALIETINDHIDLLPATEALTNADNVLIHTGNVSGHLRKALEPVKARYDFIVIDTPPKLGTLTTNALIAADTVIIPTLAESNSIDGVINFVKTLTAVNGIRKTPAAVGAIVVNRYDGRSTIKKAMYRTIEDIADTLQTAAYPVKETVKLQEAHYFRKSITEYARKTDTAGQLKALTAGALGLDPDALEG